jgi:hypothetical protein
MQLESYLKKKKMSIYKFSKLAGLTPSCIHHIITGKRTNINLYTAICIQLASSNEVQIVDLIGYEKLRFLGSKIQTNLDSV